MREREVKEERGRDRTERERERERATLEGVILLALKMDRGP